MCSYRPAGSIRALSLFEVVKFDTPETHRIDTVTMPPVCKACSISLKTDPEILYKYYTSFRCPVINELISFEGMKSTQVLDDISYHGTNYSL
jgi:hypothetical protein